VTASGFAHPRVRRAAPFDLVLANILPRPLLRLAPQMRRAVTQGGIAVLSGLLNPQAREVAMAYRAHGVRILAWQRRGGRTILTVHRTYAPQAPRLDRHFDQVGPLRTQTGIQRLDQLIAVAGARRRNAQTARQTDPVEVWASQRQ